MKATLDEVAEAVTGLRAAERHLALSHGDTRYFERGEGTPLVLLHGIGFTAGGTNWALNLGPLSVGHRVIAPDLLGFGTGGRLAQAFSFAYLVDFVRELQDALELGPCDVLGHSMGGWVASLLAYESPERVRRLVLVAAGGVATRPLASMAGFEPPPREAFDAGVAARLALPLDAVAPLAELEWESAGVPGAVDSYRRLLAHMTDPETRRRYSTARRLPRVRAETLVVWGEHDAVNDISMGRETAELLPRARLEVLPCGHAVPTESPETLHRLVLGFLTGA